MCALDNLKHAPREEGVSCSGSLGRMLPDHETAVNVFLAAQNIPKCMNLSCGGFGLSELGCGNLEGKTSETL
jgi:hypothetical protein